jgi:hypothetical protein
VLERLRARLEELSARLAPYSRLIRRFVWILAIGYVGLLILLGWQQLRHLSWPLYLEAAGVGLLIYPISFVAQALAWSLLIGRFTRSASTISWFDVRTFAATQLMKRLPGGVWYIAGRASAYGDRGLAARVPIAASASELALILTTSGVVFICLSVVQARPAPAVILAVVGAALISCLTGIVAARFRLQPRQVLGGAQDGFGTDWLCSVTLSYLLIGALYVVALLAGAAILDRLAAAGGSDRLTFEQALRLWALIAGAGAVVAVIPFGIGIRDFTVASVLSLAMTPAEAIVTAAFFRVILMVGDVIWGLPVWLICRRFSDGRSS